MHLSCPFTNKCFGFCGRFFVSSGKKFKEISFVPKEDDRGTGPTKNFMEDFREGSDSQGSVECDVRKRVFIAK
jgi:hypothetical protein